jgi:hypothetical protein
MHALAEGADLPDTEPEVPPVDWFRLTTAAGTMLDWQTVRAPDSRRGKTLLLVEYDSNDAETLRLIDRIIQLLEGSRFIG